MSIFGSLFGSEEHADDNLFDLFVMNELEEEEKRLQAEILDQEYEDDDDDWGF